MPSIVSSIVFATESPRPATHGVNQRLPSRRPHCSPGCGQPEMQYSVSISERLLISKAQALQKALQYQVHKSLVVLYPSCAPPFSMYARTVKDGNPASMRVPDLSVMPVATNVQKKLPTP